MIFFYLTKRLIFLYFFLLVLLSGLLISCSTFFRPSSVSFTQFLEVSGYFIPTALVYCIPFVSVFAIHWCVSSLMSSAFGVVVSMMRQALTDIIKAVFVFIAFSGFWYFICIMFLAPVFYSQMKKNLLFLARKHIKDLPAQTIHQLGSNLIFYYDKQGERSDRFKKILFIRLKKNNVIDFFSAQTGALADDNLTLRQGSLITKKNNHFSTMYFSNAALCLTQLFAKSENTSVQSKKYHTVFDLNLKKESERQDVFKRLLQFLLHIFSALAALKIALAEKRQSILLSSSVALVFFMAAYFFVAVIQIINFSIVTFISLMLLLAACLYLFYKIEKIVSE